ncbi:5-oxoprolinase [Gryllus bimaculatus]|nr:5-oxoprolinase [Gryllus bimaculatus]
MGHNGKFQFAIDRGGTFTDIYAKCPSGKIRVMKLLSVDPANYPDAPREGIRRILEEVFLVLRSLDTYGIFLLMGSTHGLSLGNVWNELLTSEEPCGRLLSETTGPLSLTVDHAGLLTIAIVEASGFKNVASITVRALPENERNWRMRSTEKVMLQKVSAEILKEILSLALKIRPFQKQIHKGTAVKGYILEFIPMVRRLKTMAVVLCEVSPKEIRTFHSTDRKTVSHVKNMFARRLRRGAARRGVASTSAWSWRVARNLADVTPSRRGAREARATRPDPTRPDTVI